MAPKLLSIRTSCVVTELRFRFMPTGLSITHGDITSAARAVLDRDIRKALVEQLLEPDTRRSGALVIHELGLAHAKRRVDVAVIESEIEGFEIKSANDRLHRLPGQLEVYKRALHKLTLVVAAKHVQRVMELIPPWCGVLEIRVNNNDKISFETVRETRRNPGVDPFVLAHLLWRGEVLDILSERHLSPTNLRAPRSKLYEILVKETTESELPKLIRAAMTEREYWRRGCPLR